MIPPPLREHLVRKLTQKLVDSPTFNSLVHNTHGTIAAFLEGIDEGRKEKETTQVKRADTSEQQDATQQQQQQRPQHQSQPYQSSNHQTYSRTHDFEKPRLSKVNDPRTPPPEPESSTSASSNNTTPPGLSDLEAFMRRTKASLEEAERRADAQRRSKS